MNPPKLVPARVRYDKLIRDHFVSVMGVVLPTGRLYVPPCGYFPEGAIFPAHNGYSLEDPYHHLRQKEK